MLEALAETATVSTSKTPDARALSRAQFATESRLNSRMSPDAIAVVHPVRGELVLSCWLARFGGAETVMLVVVGKDETLHLLHRDLRRPQGRRLEQRPRRCYAHSVNWGG